MKQQRYVAFLRGINVGGHHKVPMAHLKTELERLGYTNIITILNSGNVIFESKAVDLDEIEVMITDHLEKVFGFSIPIIVRSADNICSMHSNNPFKGIELTKDIRFYISLLKNDINIDLSLPWTSEDKSCNILKILDKNILSYFDLAIAGTIKGMSIIEKKFGKDITTRNWKTIERIVKKLE